MKDRKLKIAVASTVYVVGYGLASAAEGVVLWDTFNISYYILGAAAFVTGLFCGCSKDEKTDIAV
jgi:hypothetical protein